MRIIVTGGAGYIGSHLVKRLTELKHNVLVLDNLSTGNRRFLKWGSFEELDICNFIEVEKSFRVFKPDVVVHMAALSSVPESIMNPYKYYENNVAGSLNILRAARLNRVKHLIFSSTCSVYGGSEKSLISEDSMIAPISPYGFSKHVVEKILFSCDWGTHISFRYFNVAGAEASGDIGYFRNPALHLIPHVIRSLNTGTEIKVYGDNYHTNDGTCIRDYVHVDDVVDAHVKGISYLCSGGVNQVFNLGSGLGVSVKEVIRMAESALHKKATIKLEGRRCGDPERIVADIQKAEILLGWKPLNSDLEKIINDENSWYLNGWKAE